MQPDQKLDDADLILQQDRVEENDISIVGQDVKKVTPNKKLIIGLVIFFIIIILGGTYFLLNSAFGPKKLKPQVNKTTTGSLVQEKAEVTKKEWLTYTSDDQHFKIYYPGSWQKIEDNDAIFNIAKYDNQEVSAALKISKIEAKDKVQLQDALNKKRKDCLATKDANNNCLPAVDIAALKKIRISGQLARIDGDNRYQSGTTLYIFMDDYYLAIHEEYKDAALLKVFKTMINGIYLEPLYKHYYCNREPGVVSIENELSAYCYTVEPGDTLWSIAEAYYGDGHLYDQLKLYDQKKIYDLSRISPDDPRALLPGTKLVLWNMMQFSSSYNDKTAGGLSDGWGLDTDTGDFYTTASGNIYENKEVYDSFPHVYTFFVDERTNNKVYVVAPQMTQPWVFQFVVNKERNPYVGPGGNFELLTFSPDSERYAIRTNVRQDVPSPGFMVLSNLKNGPEFEYLDSIIWYDNDTLIYRAQNTDQWRLVVNNQDYKIYNYLENLRVENGVIKFDARHDDGSWTKEEITL